MSVDGESVSQPDGRVRQGERGQAGRGRKGRGLQSYVPAGHDLDCLKLKTWYNIVSIVNNLLLAPIGALYAIMCH